MISIPSAAERFRRNRERFAKGLLRSRKNVDFVLFRGVEHDA
jgi:hypothetical protein